MSRIPLIILNTLLLMGLCEGTARLAEWWHPAIEDVSFDYAPYRMLRMTRAPWTLNRDGFRSNELSSYQSGESRKFLIEFLGGSVCLGVGTNPGKTLPERLEEALHAAGLKDAAVINLCQGGATSAQELAIFLQYGLPLRPQVVLSFNGANDLMHPLPMGEDASPNLPYHNHEIQSLFEGHHGLLSHLALTRVAGRLAKHAPPRPIDVLARVPVDQILNSYLYVADVVRTLTMAQGGRYALLLQPTLHYDKPWSAEEQTMWRSRHPADYQPSSAYAHSLFTAAKIAVSSWSNTSHGSAYDLTDTFRDSTSTIYSDSVHFTGETGYRMLETELERQGLIAGITAQYHVWEHGDRQVPVSGSPQDDDRHHNAAWSKARSTQWQQ